MAKRIILAIFAGIAAVGIVLALVGFALGGRPGSITVNDGEMVYRGREEQYNLFRVPSWMGSYHSASRDSWQDWHEGDREENVSAQPVDLPFEAGELKSIEVDVGVGYVTIQQGENPGLTVNGPLPYSSVFDDGKWKIKTDYDINSIDSGDMDQGRPRFYRDGRDVTTEYIITLPSDLKKVEAELSMGILTVRSINTEEIDAALNMGTMVVENCTSENATFSVDLGAAEISGVDSAVCKLNASVGGIQFDGDVRRELEVDCDVGSVVANLPRPDTYSWEAEASLGSIQLDGSQVGLMREQKSDNGQKDDVLHLDLHCGVGSIEVTFYS